MCCVYLQKIEASFSKDITFLVHDNVDGVPAGRHQPSPSGPSPSPMTPSPFMTGHANSPQADSPSASALSQVIFPEINRNLDIMIVIMLLATVKKSTNSIMGFR